MTHTRTAIVVGSGIAGPVAAMALRQAGIEATVSEAYASTADGIGGTLTIAPNGLNALCVIGASDVVTRIGTPMTAFVCQSWTGKRLAELRIPTDLPMMQLVWRGELYRALYDEAARRGIRIEHGKRLVNVRDGDDGITARFEDGTEATADVLIGADGIRSRVRTLIDPTAPEPRYAGLLGFGAKANQTGLAPTGDKLHMIFGRRAFFGYQVSDDGSSDRWPRSPGCSRSTLHMRRW